MDLEKELKAIIGAFLYAIKTVFTYIVMAVVSILFILGTSIAAPFLIAYKDYKSNGFISGFFQGIGNLAIMPLAALVAAIINAGTLMAWGLQDISHNIGVGLSEGYEIGLKHILKSFVFEFRKFISYMDIAEKSAKSIYMNLGVEFGDKVEGRFQLVEDAEPIEGDGLVVDIEPVEGRGFVANIEFAEGQGAAANVEPVENLEPAAQAVKPLTEDELRLARKIIASSNANENKPIKSKIDRYDTLFSNLQALDQAIVQRKKHIADNQLKPAEAMSVYLEDIPDLSGSDALIKPVLFVELREDDGQWKAASGGTHIANEKHLREWIAKHHTHPTTNERITDLYTDEADADGINKKVYIFVDYSNMDDCQELVETADTIREWLATKAQSVDNLSRDRRPSGSDVVSAKVLPASGIGFLAPKTPLERDDQQPKLLSPPQ